MSDFDLTWLLSDSGESQDQLDLLANYYKEVANGPMADYRRIIQGGNKQGQNYFVHVLDGINVLHNLRNHTYELRYERLVELGNLMYAIDNLDLSHTLSEKDHKQNFLTTVNAVAERHWRWVTHRLGENRAFLSNLIHNTVVTYLKERHARDGHPIIADLLYYPDGVAYLLPER